MTDTPNGPPPPASLTLAQALQTALGHHQAGAWQDAERLYRAILRAQPNHPDANHNLGVLAVQVGQPAAGLPHFKAALEANPSQGRYWVSYVDALIRAGQPDAARQVLDQGRQRGLQGQAVEALAGRLSMPNAPGAAADPNAAGYSLALDHREAGRFKAAAEGLRTWTSAHPQDAAAHAHLAHVLSLDKQGEAAWSALSTALALDAALPVVQRNRARLLLKRQEVDEALQAAQAACQGEPDDPENRLVLAAALAAKGRADTASALLETILQTRPRYAEALATRAVLRLRTGDPGGALTDAETALSIKPHLTQLWGMVGSLRLQRNDLPGAIQALETALAHEPDNAGHLTDLGEFKRQAGQTDAAIALLERAVALAPDNASAWVNLGTALQQAQRIPEAKAAYAKALAIDPDRAELANNLGALAMDEEDWEEALRHFDQALARHPKDPRFSTNRAMALNALARPEEALDAVRKAVETDPACADVHCILGYLLQQHGRLTDAENSFLRALDIDPDHRQCALYMTINAWLQGQYPRARQYVQLALPLLNDPVARFKGSKVYTTYLARLLEWWRAHPCPSPDGTGLLHVVGESHSLAAQETCVDTPWGRLRCQAHWVEGAKMWHLAQAKPHPFQHRIAAILARLPVEAPVMLAIGEIDCRPDEGLWKAAVKQTNEPDLGAYCRRLVKETVDGYLNWLEANFRKTGRCRIIIQGVPAPGYRLEGDKDPGAGTAVFLDMVRWVNEALLAGTQTRGWHFLDVYAATAAETGVGNGQWHLDGYHLQPGFYEKADRWLKPEAAN